MSDNTVAQRQQGSVVLDDDCFAVVAAKSCYYKFVDCIESPLLDAVAGGTVDDEGGDELADDTDRSDYDYLLLRQ